MYIKCKELELLKFSIHALVVKGVCEVQEGLGCTGDWNINEVEAVMGEIETLSYETFSRFLPQLQFWELAINHTSIYNYEITGPFLKHYSASELCSWV